MYLTAFAIFHSVPSSCHPCFSGSIQRAPFKSDYGMLMLKSSLSLASNHLQSNSNSNTASSEACVIAFHSAPQNPSPTTLFVFTMVGRCFSFCVPLRMTWGGFFKIQMHATYPSPINPTYPWVGPDMDRFKDSLVTQ